MVPPTTRPAHGPVRIGVIGGSGLYHLPQFELVEETRPETVGLLVDPLSACAELP